jgi:hypothetical protein
MAFSLSAISLTCGHEGHEGREDGGYVPRQHLHLPASHAWGVHYVLTSSGDCQVIASRVHAASARRCNAGPTPPADCVHRTYALRWTPVARGTRSGVPSNAPDGLLAGGFC